MSYAPPPPPPAPAPPPPGWGPPPSKSKQGNAGIWIFLGLAAVVVAVGGFLLVGNDDEGSGGGGGGTADNPSSPEAVVEAYFAALESRDCATIVELSSEATVTAAGSTREEHLAQCESDVASGEADIPSFTLEDTELVTESGNTATVSATAIVDGQSETTDYPLVNEGGEWKIDFYNMGSSSEPPSA